MFLFFINTTTYYFVIKNIATKDTSPGTPRKVTVPNVKTLIGIKTFKDVVQRFNPYNSRNANMNFFTNATIFFPILSPI